MSDFFSKKQKKWWCEQCKKYIEYSNMIIEQHKKSKNHQKMVNQTLIYEHRKAKAQRIIKNANAGIDDRTFSQIEQIEKSAQQSFNVNDSHRFEANNNNNINFPNNNKKFNEKSGNILSSKDTYNTSNNFLEEIKMEKLQSEHKELFNKNYLKKKKNREWGVFFDESTKKPFYHNFYLKKSQWDKPVDFDGPEALKNVDIKDPEIKKNLEEELKVDNEKTNNSNKGVIGKWEVVDPKDSFFEKYKANESEIKENFYSEVDFLRKQNESGESDMDEIDNDEENYEQNKEQNTQKGTIDDYIKGNIQNECKTFLEIGNEEIININEKLKLRDYDLRFVDQMYTSEEKNVNNIKQKTDELLDGQTIAFSFKSRKDDSKKKMNKSIFFEED